MLRIGDKNVLFAGKKVTIYGAEWDGSSTTTWTRTDAAAGFTDPVPYVSGASSYSSPFDNIYPWNGMQIIEDSTAGSLVSIPKYYYKWTKTGDVMKLQITDKPMDGFYVSPAHADRGDGKGERDVVYVGRYHCNSSYKSASGSNPITGMTMSTSRTGIHNIGSAYWQYDFAMYWTICMLYLVEFADWNSQTKIGYGCSTNNSLMSVGYTDNMPYHTGTTSSSRTNYGGTQYRYIEGLWDNVLDFCEGIYNKSGSIYCIKNPNNFANSKNGILVNTITTSTGYIQSFNIPTNPGFEYALCAGTITNSENKYIPDYHIGPSGSTTNLVVGGAYSQNIYWGLFTQNFQGSGGSGATMQGCRLQKLP